MKEDFIGGEAAGRRDNLEAITMTATTTQMGRPGGGSSHTPRLNTLTWLEMMAAHTNPAHTWRGERVVVWSVCVRTGGKKENRECGGVLIVSHHGCRMCMCASDRLGELRRLNTMAYPSVANANHGSGPRLTVTWVTVPTAHHWTWHTRACSHEHTGSTRTPLIWSHLSFTYFLLLLFSLNLIVSLKRQSIVWVKTRTVSLTLNKCEIYVWFIMHACFTDADFYGRSPQCISCVTHVMEILDNWGTGT